MNTKDEFQWKVFNDIRFDKWEFYCQLKDNEKLTPFLPETELLTADSLITMLQRHPKVILKPKNLSRGRGISIITLESPGTFVIHDYRYYNDFTIAKSQFEEYLQEGKYLDNEYIIQPFLNLANIDGSPWDIRVVMQKNGENQWVCNGIECRLAPTGKLITNISNGGRALHLKEALELTFGKEVESDLISKDIHAISMEFCKKWIKQDVISLSLGWTLPLILNNITGLLKRMFVQLLKGLKDWMNKSINRYAMNLFCIPHPSQVLAGGEMKIRINKVIPDLHANNCLTIHPDVAKYHNLSSNKKWFLRFGTQALEMKLKTSSVLNEDEIKLSISIIKLLRIPINCRFEIRRENNEILLGPFIGIRLEQIKAT